ncbi:MAG: hypothetical protein H0T78_07570 [Longispora sp.]|nr:hypothetical protein [Longispora sp. (in: high G+C Gram-positive bacteria)]
MPENNDLESRINALETTLATQAATQAGMASTNAAAHAGVMATMASGSVALLAGMFLGLMFSKKR